MKQSLLRKTILVSLLGIASAQTSSWGEPFTVEASEAPITSTAAAPDDTFTPIPLPSPVETSTWGEPFTPDVSVVPTSLSVSGSETTTLVVDTTPVASSAAISTGNTTAESSTMNTSSTSSTNRSSGTVSSSASATTSSETGQASGAAAPLRGYQKMAFAGAIAGVGGIMLI